jgi:mRNA interferase RelE/StbE
MNILYAKRAVKVIERMAVTDKKRIKQAIELLPSGDVKRLQGYDNWFRLRVGDWRIVFEQLSANEIMIEKIAPRGQIYKGW